MGTRELKGLLRVLRDSGVTSYTCGDLNVTFAARNVDVATAAEAAGPEHVAPDSMDLPDEVFDPRRKLEEINRKAAANRSS